MPRLDHSITKRGLWSPLHGAFTFTLFASVFLIAGSLGYEIKRSGGVPYLRWTGGVAWEQILWGIGSAVVAAVFWAVSLRPAKSVDRIAGQRAR